MESTSREIKLGPSEAIRYAVLTSGGLDSAILLAESIRQYACVYPLYVRSGLAWEPTELQHLLRYLKALHHPALQPLVELEMPVADLYQTHWSLTGQKVPDAASPDEAVYLPGRNVLLLGKAILWCHLHQVPAVALGTLKNNPFPDASAEFFAGFEKIVNDAIGGSVRIERPFADLDKTAVMMRGRSLPLHLTFSCINPAAGRHCGRCNKCAERRRAFREAGMPDATAYDREKPCTT
jgi:7-cyano-7-deazaguanine synthase